MAETTSTTVTANDPVGEYKSIKALVRAQLHAVGYGSRPEDLGDQYNLASCGDMELALGLGGDETDAFARVAGYAYTWETELPQVGYPPKTVLILTRDIEERLLAYVVSHRADSAFEEAFYDRIRLEADKLATKLTRLAQEQNLKAAKVAFMDECGGGGSLITFKIPAEARMFVIPPLYIKYCQNQNIDPTDRVTCDHYREVIDGSEEMLAGLYTYVAIWSDGYTKTGQFDAAKIPEVFNLKK